MVMVMGGREEAVQLLAQCNQVIEQRNKLSRGVVLQRLKELGALKPGDPVCRA